ncbi:hypothetical protein JCM8097_002481 [Rhodosporidiobolus ruineniae]
MPLPPGQPVAALAVETEKEAAGELRAQGAMETADTATLTEREEKRKPAEGSEGTITPVDGGSKEVKKTTGRKRTPLDIALDDPEFANVKPEHRRVLAEQIVVLDRKKIGFSTLFRFHTRSEHLINAVGVICAIAYGIAQPAMALLFGNLTTAFSNYSMALQRSNEDAVNGADELARATNALQNSINTNALNLLYIGLAMFVANFVAIYSWSITGESATRRIRENYLAAVLRQNAAWHDKSGAGAITSRIETDTNLIQLGISDKVTLSVGYISMFFAGLVIGIIINWRLALVMSVIVPLCAILGGVFEFLTAKYKRLQLDAVAKGATLAEEVISSIRSVVAFHLQGTLVKLYEDPNEECLKYGLTSAIGNAATMASFNSVLYGAYGLAFFYGTTLILQGRSDAGNVMGAFFSVLIGAYSLAQLAPTLQAMANASGAATEIFNTIDRVPSIDSASEEGLTPERVEGLIETKDVQFIYPSRPSVQVLHGFTAVFPPGKMTALVGGSGSGKSTTVGLLERFYDPVEGSIKLDGVELRDLNLKWLRNQIGLVSQEPTLFATTVAGNIEHGLIGSRFEHESADERRKRVVKAAKLANADGFISNLPLGYDTQIGERGMLLSGGQKQRIAIARAIVSDPKILLLDEATSALDTQSETIVQDALDRAAAGRTTITIAHRLSTIKDADQIIVLTAGHILESAMSNSEGTAHDLLLRSPEGAYSKLVKAQALKEAVVGHEETDGDKADPDEVVFAPETSDAEVVATGERAPDIEEGVVEVVKKYGFITLMRRMLAVNKDLWMHYLVGLVAATTAGCAYPVYAIVFGHTIEAFSDADRSELRSTGNRMALYAFIIAIVVTITTFFQHWTFGVTTEHLAARLRLLVFRSTLQQDIEYFDRPTNSTGALTSSISAWAEKVNNLLGTTTALLVQSVATMVVGIIMGLCYSWRIALVGIAVLPLTLGAGLTEVYLIFMKDEKLKVYYTSSAQMAAEAAAAVRTVAALTREEDICHQYSSRLAEPTHHVRRFLAIAYGFYSLTMASTLWVVALIFWWGAKQLIEGHVSVKSFYVVLEAIIFSSMQAGAVFAFVPQVSAARSAASQIVTLLDRKPSIPASVPLDPSHPPHPPTNGAVGLDRVLFRYPTRKNVPVLQGLSIEVKPGQFCAIVGASGCGKSTTIQLIERFYDPSAGSVVLDGQDIRTLHLPSYRRDVALVSQEPTLYSGSIRFNVALGLAGAGIDPDEVKQEDVERACREANLHEFIEGLPEGYETDVGGKGTQLSGGQKQRVAIARALIRNPKILLLDEATSALDSQSEAVVQRALDQAAKNRTTIAIAHRLSTVQNADVIFCLNGGRVVEEGTHGELLAKKGLYAELVAQQTLARR